MTRTTRFYLLLLAMIMALLASAVGPYAVYADDGVPVDPPTGETGEVDLVDEEASQTEPSAEETPAEESVEQVAELLDQAPEGTELVVINQEGEVEPLATEEAMEIIATSDPMWCPEGATPGDASCTGSFSDFASLIAALAADGGSTYYGNGVIWVEDGYNGNDDNQVEFDGTVLNSLNNLTVQGGWSGGNNTTITGTSDLDVSMVFVNWNGNITLNDLNIAASDGAGFGLFVENTGSTSLDNVSVNNTTANSYGFGDGAVVISTGNVDIVDSEFDGNAGNGLLVASNGTIELDTVSASNNSLTGAFLDNCDYNGATGLCTGIGTVTITSSTANMFDGNGFTGLVVDSGGGIVMDDTQANNNGLDGALLTSSDDDGTGNVSVTDSDFSGNANGTGLDIYADGNIDLTNVSASSNGTGAILDTTSGTGAVTVTDSEFGDSLATGNTWTGLHVESGSTVSLVNVIASYNGTNGAYLTAEGDIDVTDSTFNENVNFDYPQDPGLYANSNGGDITLTDVIADGNEYGAGAVLITKGAGDIDVISTVPGGSHFNGNGTFGVQAQTVDGDITITDIEASNNEVKGAYLNSAGAGNIFIYGSDFVENGSYGIYAATNQGDINLDHVTVTGNGQTEIGAILKAQNGGSVFVGNSTFELNNGVGLIIVSSPDVDLVNVTADQNGADGVQVYSPYTFSCRCPDSQPSSVIVNVDGGTFTNNGGYGLTVKPGPEGDLIFVNPSVFGGNTLGDYLLDLSDPAECPDEVCNCEEENDEPKDPNIVYVPSTGGEPVEQDCELFSSTILELPNGTWVNVGCPFEGFSNLEELLEGNLPGQLGAGTDFVSGVTVSLTDGEGNTTLNQDGTITITFKLPENSRDRSYSILFWDPTLNDGEGGWVKLPVYEFGTSFPLHPDNSEDERVIVSGVQQVGDTVTVTVNFPGVFILVTP